MLIVAIETRVACLARTLQGFPYLIGMLVHVEETHHVQEQQIGRHVKPQRLERHITERGEKQQARGQHPQHPHALVV